MRKMQKVLLRCQKTPPKKYCVLHKKNCVAILPGGQLWKDEKMMIRELKAADVEAVSKIEQEVFSMPWSPKDFLEMVEADYAYYYVAEEDGEIAGCCGIRNIAGEGEITNVAVAEKFRRRGIGRTLMQYMLREAALHGIGAVTLEVRISNTPAICLYESLGFISEGVRPGFYEKPKEDALIMWKR